MSEILLYVIIGLQGVLLIVGILLLLRGRNQGEQQALAQATERIERAVRDEIGRNRDESRQTARESREESALALRNFGDSLGTRVAELSRLQAQQFESVSQNITRLTESNEKRLEAVRLTIEQKLEKLQTENTAKLDQMRALVDEKLQSTLEKRLGESFKTVREQLEAVHKGLGEMQALASGVGDLKRVLTNVKTRGTWGEVQLGALLEQIFTIDQYAANVATRPGSNDRVEYAVRLPGADGDGPLWLPIDAKFPLEDYQRLLDAQEQGDLPAVERCARDMENRIRLEAKRIREKYVEPPHTADFAILFLPTEGLYAEVLRRPGLFESLQRECKVVVAGPTTLTAILHSLQMGFRTLAIEKRSSEVWTLLAGVKTEFGKFGTALDKVRKKLQEASNSVDQVGVRSRAMQRKLRDVEELPVADSDNLLALDEPDTVDLDDEEGETV